MWGVNTVDILEELVIMFSLMDGIDVIHIPKPEPGWMGAELMAFASNSSMNRLAVRSLMGEPMAAPWTCSKCLHWNRK